LNYGTANGVVYLNGSKVATTGSALTFNGTTLAVTGAFEVTRNTGTIATLTQTSATGYGLTIIPGADTNYQALTINNAANTLNNISMYGDGTAKFAKTLGVGNATPSTSGAGITFPATQSASTDANTLDDYEEGTFTATFGGQTNVGSVSQNRYSYVKVGRTVTVFANFAFTPTASNAFVYWFFSLPFPAEFNNNNASGCVDNNNGRTGSVSTFGSNTGNGYVLFPTTSQLSTAANSVYISFTYMAAS
jgi:peroxiredoxin